MTNEPNASNLTEGWAFIHLGEYKYTKKAHYLRNRRSLCGKYAILFGKPEYEQGNDNSPDNCPTCAKKLAKEKAKGEQT